MPLSTDLFPQYDRGPTTTVTWLRITGGQWSGFVGERLRFSVERRPRGEGWIVFDFDVVNGKHYKATLLAAQHFAEWLAKRELAPA